MTLNASLIDDEVNKTQKVMTDMLRLQAFMVTKSDKILSHNQLHQFGPESPFSDDGERISMKHLTPPPN
jgi:hypothetical protein